MCRPTTAEQFARVRRLHQLGVSVDYDEFEQMTAESAGLSISQNGPSMIVGLPTGQAACSFDVFIANYSTRHLLAPSSIRFEGPDWLSGLRLLPDPRRTKADGRVLGKNIAKRIKYPVAYFLRPDQCAYEIHEVLNHRLGERHKLLPGDGLEGYLLAITDSHIPLDCKDGDKVQLRVKLFDQRGRPSSRLFMLVVDMGTERRKLVAAIEESKSRTIQRKRVA